MRKIRNFVVIALAALAAATTGAHGQTFSARLNGISPGESYVGSWNTTPFDFPYPAGVMNFTDLGSGMEFFAFCVQPLEGIGFEEILTYEIQGPSSLTSTQTDLVARLVGAYLSEPVNDQKAAAVQWAIWEVTTETAPVESLFDGSVRIIDPSGSSTATLANQYLADVMTYSPVALTYLANPTRQDVMTWSVVPEPGTVGLALISGLLLFCRRRY